VRRAPRIALVSETSNDVSLTLAHEELCALV